MFARLLNRIALRCSPSLRQLDRLNKELDYDLAVLRRLEDGGILYTRPGTGAYTGTRTRSSGNGG
jgi:hypothetical protein